MITDNYAAGGYMVSKYFPRPPGLGDELLPEQLISMSACLGKLIPTSSLIAWAQPNASGIANLAGDFNLPPNKIDRARRWVTDRFGSEIGWPGIALGLGTAREFAREFLRGNNEVFIIGIGLHESLREKMIRFERASNKRSPKTDEASRSNGVWWMIETNQKLPPGGEPLGFELIQDDENSASPLGCSWLCNGLHEDFQEHFGVAPNFYGLLDKFEQASRCAKAINEHEFGIQAEPGLWLPWLLVRYSVCAFP